MSDLIRLNLLDWRGARRQARQQSFFVALGMAGVLAIAAFVLLPYWYYGQLIGAQEAENEYLQTQINLAEQRLAEIRDLKETRRRIINRMEVIEDLQNARPAIVRYFDQLVATVPQGVHLTSLEQSGTTTTLKGVAESNARISEYMSNLAGSAWFASPRLIVIQRGGGDDNANFTLRVKSTRPASESEDKNTAGGQ